VKTVLLFGFHASGHLIACERLASILRSAGHDTSITSPIDRLADSVGQVYRVFAGTDAKGVPATLARVEFLQELYRETAHSLKQELRDYEAVVSTHPYCSWLAAEYKVDHERDDLFLVDVHTNYTNYPQFPHDGIDWYVGPPLRFYKAFEPRALAMGLPPPPRCLGINAPLLSISREGERPLLVMGGADGFGPIEEAVKQLLALNLPMIVITGRNAALETKLRREFAGSRSVEIRGYVPDASSLMPSCQGVISKASGMTLTDTFWAGVPAICTPPILPWEAEAMTHLGSMGAVYNVWEWNIASLQGVKELLGDVERTLAQTERARRFLNPRYDADMLQVVVDRHVGQHLRRHPADEVVAVKRALGVEDLATRLGTTPSGRMVLKELRSHDHDSYS
jgi:hypothetical protein